MKSFTLLLQDASHIQKIESVTSFIAEDASGSFGIRPDHARMMTSLVFGLARFRCAKQPWRYIALPGALLYFSRNELSISTRHYLVDEDYERISIALREQFLTEEEELHAVKESLLGMERQLLKRLWKFGQELGSNR